MKSILLRIPNDLLAKIDTQGKSLNAEICKAIAAYVQADYTPPMRGGRRVPNDLTAAEIARARVTPEYSPAPIEETVHKAAKRSIEAQHVMPPALLPNIKLKEQGYPYAEGMNGVFTGKLLSKFVSGSASVGEMTLAEFQRRAGKKAYV